jgi:hypothetical protein
VDGHLGVLSEGGSLEGPIVVRAGNGGVQVSPSGHCGLLVPEPLGGHLRHVGGGHVGDPGGDFGAVDEAVEVGELFGIGQGDVGGLVELEQIVEVLVPGAEDLGLVDLYGVRLTCWA